MMTMILGREPGGADCASVVGEARSKLHIARNRWRTASGLRFDWKDASFENRGDESFVAIRAVPSWHRGGTRLSGW